MKRRLKKFLSVCLILTLLLPSNFVIDVTKSEAATGDTTTRSLQDSALLEALMAQYTSFIVVKHKQLGNSDYAYTDSLSEYKDDDSPEREYSFFPGSQLILMTLVKQGDGTVSENETVLIDSPDGLVRDPDVSADGSKVVFSWKKNDSDDFHLYEMTIATKEVKQLTYGSGVADVEPCYCADGSIIFESTRDQETIDCWVTEVFNLFKCDADGGNIIRLGYDQVATTGVTACEDGRLLYTRWDYNDRGQMFVQSIFQMFEDGTMQTEVYGNDSNWPTTLLHTREIPGVSGKYISIVSGHHVLQAGKVCIVDTNKGRNDKEAVNYIFPNEYNNKNDNVDTLGQEGPMYKYPYALNEKEFWVSRAAGGWNTSDKRKTDYDICLMNTEGESVILVDGSNDLPAAQMVPIKTSNLFQRASLVNYSGNQGTYYIGNVYEGDSMKGVKHGDAKYLRVVALDYRYAAVGATQGAGTGTSDPYSPIATGNGSWDVKRVLGIVPIEDDGSVLFHCPSETPVYFQVLNKDGEMIQSMRSWSTLQPGEYFSCVGCHEDKNVAPPSSSTTTKAMAKGVQEIQPDLWMTGEQYEKWDAGEDSKGFDYEEVVQPILDNNCLTCHNNTSAAKDEINYSNLSTAEKEEKETILEVNDSWRYTMNNPGADWYSGEYDASGWEKDVAPFGRNNTQPGTVGTVWNSQGDIYLKNSFQVNAYQMEDSDINLYLACTKNPEIYINGQLFYKSEGTISGYEAVGDTAKLKSMLREGANSIAVKATADNNKQFVGLYLEAAAKSAKHVTLVENSAQWKYQKTGTKRTDTDWAGVDFNDDFWATGQAPFGDRSGQNTDWSGGDTYIYIRKTFDLTREQVSAYGSAQMYLRTFYDDNPVFYLNGHIIYSPKDWVDGFTTVSLGSEFSQYLKEGRNVFAIYCQNDTGGRQIDSSLYLDTSNVSSRVTLVEQSEQWKYQKSATVMSNTDWAQVSYNDNAWSSGQAPFGDRSEKGFNTYWGGDDGDLNHIYLRKTFHLTAAQVEAYANTQMYMCTFYDDNPVFYLNGHEIASKVDWVDNYTTISLGKEVSKYLKEGTNVFAIYCKNTMGGRLIDASLYLNTEEQTTVFSEKSDWKVLRDHTPDNVPGRWSEEDFDDSSWANESNGISNYSMKYVYLRKKFELSPQNVTAIKNGQMKLYVNIFYDESPTIYINGHEVLSREGYNTEYTMMGLPTTMNQYLHEGTNTIAIVSHDTAGGQYIDCGLTVKSIGSANKQFSLKGTGIYASRMKREYPLSYLVLTQSYPANNGTEFMASSINSLTNWISSMSQSEALPPFAYGSSKSNVINLLESGHGNLTTEELNAIRCWIDLGVPCYGTYDKGAKNWSAKERKEFQTKWKKRLSNDTQDKYAKLSRAGLLKNGKNLTVTFNGTNGNTFTDTQDTYVKLRVPQVYKPGDKITVKLPQNEHYIAVNLNIRMGESIIYVSGDTYTYTIPDDYSSNYDTRFDEYTDNVITVRVPTNQELAKTHNLASNVYDLTTSTTLISGDAASAKPNTGDTTAFPHAFTDSICRNGGEFAVRNAIDGMSVNNGHGAWPLQSWGPELGDHWLGVDFGHEVSVSGVTMYIRADFSDNLTNSQNDHDTYYTSATVQFSDGSTQVVSMKKTADAQEFIFAKPVTTTYVKVIDMAVAQRDNRDDWCGISELQVMGRELVQVDEPVEPETTTEAPEESIIPDITTKPQEITTPEVTEQPTESQETDESTESQVTSDTTESQVTEPETTSKYSTDSSIPEPFGLVVSKPKDNTIGIAWGYADGDINSFNIYIDGELVMENATASYYEFEGYAAGGHTVEIARTVEDKESVRVGVTVVVEGSNEGKTTAPETEVLTTKLQETTALETDWQETTPYTTEPQVTESQETKPRETTSQIISETTDASSAYPTDKAPTSGANKPEESSTTTGDLDNPSVVKGLVLQSVKGKKITFTWELTEEQIALGQSYNVYIDGKLYHTYIGAAVVEYTFAVAGEHTIVIKAVLNGNEEAAGVTLKVTVEGDNSTNASGQGGTTTVSPAAKTTQSANVSVAKAKVKKVKKKLASKKVKITLKKIAGAKYQVKVSTTKKFKKKKTVTKKKVKKEKFTIKSKKIANKKVLYVKARAYKVVNGKTYYGKWSKVKKVKIKK